MAGQAPALSPALHPHLGLLAQSGRALLWLDHPGPHPTRRLHLRSRARSGHPPIPRPSQCRPQALRLDQIRGRNPRKSHPCARCARTACFRESSVKSATLARSASCCRPNSAEAARASECCVLGCARGRGRKHRRPQTTDPDLFAQVEAFGKTPMTEPGLRSACLSEAVSERSENSRFVVSAPLALCRLG